MHAGLGVADALGGPLAALTGVPVAYNARFGFRPARQLGVAAPVHEWEPYFLVRPLTTYEPALRSGFSYPTPFTP